MAPRSLTFEKGDILTIEAEVLRARAGGTVTFSLFGHPGVTRIPGDSPGLRCRAIRIGVDHVEKVARHQRFPVASALLLGCRL